MKNQRQVRRENSISNAAPQLRRKASPKQATKAKSATVSDLPPKPSPTPTAARPLKSATTAHLEKEWPLPEVPRPFPLTARICTSIPGSYLCTEWEDVWLIRFLFDALETAGPWRWASVIQRVAKTESPEYVQRISLGIMEMVLLGTHLEGEFEHAMNDYDDPLEQCSNDAKSGLANWNLAKFGSLMFEFCCTLHDVKDALCDEIEAGGKDWDAASAEGRTASTHLKLAEALMVAELWLQREGIETELGEEPRAWDDKPTRIEALARSLRQSLYMDAFNVMAAKANCAKMAA